VTIALSRRKALIRIVGGIYNGNNNFGLSTNTIILFAFVLGAALMISYGYLILSRLFTKQLIWITGILQISLGIGTAIVYFVRQYYSAAIVFIIFSVFYIIWYAAYLKSIPLIIRVHLTLYQLHLMDSAHPIQRNNAANDN